MQITTEPDGSLKGTSENGLYLSDLIELAAKRGIKPENLCLTLTVEDVECSTSCIVEAVAEMWQDEAEEHGPANGMLWLHITDECRQIMRDQ